MVFKISLLYFSFIFTSIAQEVVTTQLLNYFFNEKPFSSSLFPEITEGYRSPVVYDPADGIWHRKGDPQLIILYEDTVGIKEATLKINLDVKSDVVYDSIVLSVVPYWPMLYFKKGVSRFSYTTQAGAFNNTYKFTSDLYAELKRFVLNYGITPLCTNCSSFTGSAAAVLHLKLADPWVYFNSMKVEVYDSITTSYKYFDMADDEHSFKGQEWLVEKNLNIDAGKVFCDACQEYINHIENTSSTSTYLDCISRNTNGFPFKQLIFNDINITIAAQSFYIYGYKKSALTAISSLSDATISEEIDQILDLQGRLIQKHEPIHFPVIVFFKSGKRKLIPYLHH